MRSWTLVATLGLVLASACTADDGPSSAERDRPTTGSSERTRLVPLPTAEVSVAPGAAHRRLDGLDHVARALWALDAVWATISARPDEFSLGHPDAAVVMIDPDTGARQVVLEGLAVEPDVAVAGERVWVAASDRIVALDAEPGPRRPLAVGAEVWVPNRGSSTLFIVDTDGLAWSPEGESNP